MPPLDQAADAPCRPAAARDDPGVVDRARFPIDDLEAPAGRSLVEAARRSLADDGCAVLKGFVRLDALAAMTGEDAGPVAGGAFQPHRHESLQRRRRPLAARRRPAPDVHGADQRLSSPATGSGRRPRSGGSTTTRPCRPSSPPRSGVGRLHEYADPFAGLVVNVLKPGCQHPWHLRQHRFRRQPVHPRGRGRRPVRILPQPCAAERTRTTPASPRCWPATGRPVRALDLRPPATCRSFFGRNSLHRVTRIEGERERHTLILGYTQRPGVIAGAERTRRLFGGVAQAHLDADAAGRSVEAGRR